MSKARVKVLQIGDGEDCWNPTSVWQDLPTLWDYVAVENFDDWLASVEEGEEAIPSYSLIFITGLLEKNFDFETLLDLADPYAFVVDEKMVMDHSTWILFERRAQPWILDLSIQSQDEWLLDFYRYFFSNQYGERRQIGQFDILHPSTFHLEYVGHHRLQLNDISCDDWIPLASLKSNVNHERYEPLDFWLEFEASDQLELALKVSAFHPHNDQLIQEVWFNLQSPDQCHVDIGESCVLSFNVFVKGQGKLSLGPLHMRYSRGKFGQYLLGGERLFDENREELACYFHPGNLKPPLNIYFSGYRTAEGFEGFFMMKGFDHPYLLVTDPRLEGGDFYMASDELEKLLIKKIKDTLDDLGFDHDQVIFSGLSMGTFGDLYYGSFFSPYAIIVGKPLIHISQVARNLRIKRPNEFMTSLDMVLKELGKVTEEGLDQLDQLLSRRLKLADFDRTTLAIAYMEQDDYDTTAYYSILDCLAESSSRIISRGYMGRHNDESQKIGSWFVNQYRRLLANFEGEEENENSDTDFMGPSR